MDEVTLENLKVFKDIAQSRRISKGASLNGISQSAASQLIQHLERELGRSEERRVGKECRL